MAQRCPGEPVIHQTGKREYLRSSYPCYSFALAAWIPCVVGWDPETGVLERVEGPVGFPTWREAQEASRFLARAGDAERA
ncbi:MAG: hypothetical protein HY294_15030 [Candidatus Rokubacteria bacterium]|nr:hypothetical protein [Candidatus Rokubacteria bacterium]